VVGGPVPSPLTDLESDDGVVAQTMFDRRDDYSSLLNSIGYVTITLPPSGGGNTMHS
jgi:hypothetical protein